MSVVSSNKILSKCIIVYCKVALLYTELRLRLLWSQRRSSSSSESISLNVVVSVVRVISQNTAATWRGVSHGGSNPDGGGTKGEAAEAGAQWIAAGLKGARIVSR